jgi:hypothetical protein
VCVYRVCVCGWVGGCVRQGRVNARSGGPERSCSAEALVLCLRLLAAASHNTPHTRHETQTHNARRRWLTRTPRRPSTPARSAPRAIAGTPTPRSWAQTRRRGGAERSSCSRRCVGGPCAVWLCVAAACVCVYVCARRRRRHQPAS